MTWPEKDRQSSGLLRYFGMETPEKVFELVLWSLPYLLALCAGLVVLSYIVHWINPLPLWVYFLAILLALLYFFLFLARVRQSASEAPGGPDHKTPGS